MRSFVLLLFFCASALAASSSPGVRPANVASRPPGFESLPSGSVPALEDVLPAEIVARKIAAGGHAVTSSTTLVDGWKLILIRFQQWDYDLADWVDWERDSSVYDANGRLASLTARWVQQGVWVNYYKFLYAYDNAGNLEQFRSQYADGLEWINYVKYAYTYDAQNRQLSFTHIKWFSGDWQNVRRYNFSYDGNGNQTFYFYEHWDGVDWAAADRTFFDYDSLNRRVNTVSQTLVDTLWTNIQHDSIAYNAAGLPDTIITQRWLLDVKLWGNSSSIVLAYDASGDETMHLNRIWMDTTWEEPDRTISVYSPAGHLLSVTRQIDTSSHWDDVSRDVYAYDPRWNLASFVTQTWSGSAWLSSIQYVYTYDTRNNRLTELAQRFDGVEWVYKSLNTFAFDGIGNRIGEVRQIWSGYNWIYTAGYRYSYLGANQLFGVQEKWNMVSLPLTVGDYTKSVLFPTATSDAYGYDQSYASSGILENGRAYWIKFPSSQSIALSGLARTLDTIDVAKGWNMVGSLSTPMAVSEIASIPGGIVTGNFYAYNAGYQPSATLEPMRGYWVKLTEAGQLVLDATLSIPPANAIRVHDSGERPPPPPPESIALSGNGVPEEYALSQNYPNPFNPSTIISYQVPEEVHVTLKLYNTLGQEVATVLEEIQSAGYKSVMLQAGTLPSGVYYYTLRAGKYFDTKKFMLMR